MGRAFYETSGAAKRVFEEASEALGADFTRLIFEGPEADLALTANTQPAVLTASVAAAAACAERGSRRRRWWPGTVSASTRRWWSPARSVSADAVRDRAAARRAHAGGRAGGHRGDGGAHGREAGRSSRGVCVDAAQGEVVGIANLNSEMQIVIAGHRTAVERAVALAKERGGRKSVLLPVSAPFHCALMAPAGERLAPDLAALEIARSHDSRRPQRRRRRHPRPPSDVVPFLLRQVASPVRWTACVERLAAEGADTFVEVGPGRVLTGLRQAHRPRRAGALGGGSGRPRQGARGAGGRHDAERTLDGKVAIVTGGSRGIGAAVAAWFERARSERGSLGSRRRPAQAGGAGTGIARRARFTAWWPTPPSARMPIGSWTRPRSGSAGSTSWSTMRASHATAC